MSQDEVFFRAGVTACLRSWSALRTAVLSGWGGGPLICHAKAEDLRLWIIQQYNEQSAVLFSQQQSLDELEDSLAIYLEEEFSVTLEDGSERQVAETLIRLAHECRTNPDTATTMVQQLLIAAETAVATANAIPTHLQSNEHDDDDEDEDMMDATAPPQAIPTALPIPPPVPQSSIPSTNLEDYIRQPLFDGCPDAVLRERHLQTALQQQQQREQAPVRQLGEAAPPPEAPEMAVDDDGFATVPTKGKRRKPR